MLFAIKFYDNPQAVTKDDFESDLKRIRYIKRLLKRYKNSGELKVHLILNHLTVLFNVFDEAAVPLLFYNLEKDLFHLFLPFARECIGFMYIYIAVTKVRSTLEVSIFFLGKWFSKSAPPPFPP